MSTNTCTTVIDIDGELDNVIQFTTDSMSEFTCTPHANGTVTIDRRGSYSLTFHEFRVTTQMPDITLGEPVRGVDIDGLPYNTSAVTAIIENGVLVASSTATPQPV